VIHALPSAVAQARQLASRLGLSVHTIDVHRFPDSELRVTVGPVAPTTIVYAPFDQPNEKLLAILFAAEALRREGARRLVLVAPYLCYMRQDAAFHKGEAISQKVIGPVLARSFDRIVTVDAHLHRTKEITDVFPGSEAEDLAATPAIARFLHENGFDRQCVVVGPDDESLPWVEDLAGRLGLACAVAHKTRRGDHSVEMAFSDAGIFRGCPVLLVDDIVSSGATLIACAQAVRAAGATTIDAIITHALFAPELLGEFLRAGIRSVRSTDSVPHPTNAIALDEILAETLRNELG